jgi:hypothetical protein
MARDFHAYVWHTSKDGDDLFEKEARKRNGIHEGAGTDFRTGWRDIEWSFPNKKSRDSFLQTVKKIKGFRKGEGQDRTGDKWRSEWKKTITVRRGSNPGGKACRYDYKSARKHRRTEKKKRSMWSKYSKYALPALGVGAAILFLRSRA